jgi:hypothetical protein
MTEDYIKIENLTITVFGYSYLESSDYWDGNWINVNVYYKSGISEVSIKGDFLHLTEIDLFMNDCKKVLSGETNVITLPTMENNLQLSLMMNLMGQISGEIVLSSNDMKEKHEYEINIDQSYLPEIMKQCESVLLKFPIKGSL